MPSYRRQSRKYQKAYNPLAYRAQLYGTAGAQLAKDVAYLGALINSEPNYKSVESTNNFDHNGTILSLDTMAVGDSMQLRHGNSILERYVNIKGSVFYPTSGVSGGHTAMRVMVFRFWGQDSSVAGTIPTASEILASSGGQFGPYSQLNDNQSGRKGDRERRIEVLKNVQVTLDENASRSLDFDWNIEINGASKKVKSHTKYHGATNEVPISGGTFIMFISDNATNTNAGYKFRSKVTFYDN